LLGILPPTVIAELLAKVAATLPPPQANPAHAQGAETAQVSDHPRAPAPGDEANAGE
jgi:hypothetical protein